VVPTDPINYRNNKNMLRCRRLAGHPCVYNIYHPPQPDTWLSRIFVGSRLPRLGEWEELTPAKAVEDPWRSQAGRFDGIHGTSQEAPHRGRAIFNLIFEMLGFVYRLLLGGAVAPSAAALFIPASVHDTASPPHRGGPSPGALARAARSPTAERHDTAASPARRKLWDTTPPGRLLSSGEEGAAAQDARVRWENTPTYVHEYTVQAPLRR